MYKLVLEGFDVAIHTYENNNWKSVERPPNNDFELLVVAQKRSKDGSLMEVNLRLPKPVFEDEKFLDDYMYDIVMQRFNELYPTPS